jgi:hypothetical protein
MAGDRWDPVSAVAIGALLGATVGFVCFLPSRRRLLAQVDSALDEALDQMRLLQDAAAKVWRAFEEGRRTMYAVEHMADPAGLPIRGHERARR